MQVGRGLRDRSSLVLSTWLLMNTGASDEHQKKEQRPLLAETIQTGNQPLHSRIRAWYREKRPHDNNLNKEPGRETTSRNMSGVLFEDIFDVKDIDPDGKKFDRGESLSQFISSCRELRRMCLFLWLPGELVNPRVWSWAAPCWKCLERVSWDTRRVQTCPAFFRVCHEACHT